jgi:hypothetical protein
VSLGDAFGNEGPLCDYYRAYAAGKGKVDGRTCFDYRFRIRPAANPTDEWRPLDPASDRGSPRNEWWTLYSVVKASGLKPFDAEYSPPDSWFKLPKRFDLSYAEGADSDGKRTLQVTRRELTTKDPRRAELFRMLSKTDWNAVPVAIGESGLKELKGQFVETHEEYALGLLGEQGKECFERALVTQHFIFATVLDEVLQLSKQGTSFGIHPEELLNFHMTNPDVVHLARSSLLSEIRRVHPSFSFHRRSAKSLLTKIEDDARGVTRPPPDPPAVGTGEPLRAQDTELIPIAFENEVELERMLQFISCELHFRKYRVAGSSAAAQQGVELATILALDLHELRGTWSTAPTVSEVAYDDFWRRAVWSYSPDKRARSSISMTSMRYALYDPPYGGASELAQEILDPYLMRGLFGEEDPAQRYDVYA